MPRPGRRRRPARRLARRKGAKTGALEGGPPAPTRSCPAKRDEFAASFQTGIGYNGGAAQKNPSAAKSVALAEARRGPPPAGLWAKWLKPYGPQSSSSAISWMPQPVWFEKKHFSIGFDPEFEDHLGLVDNARNHTLSRPTLAELGHANAQINSSKSKRPPTAASKTRRWSSSFSLFG